MTFVLGMLTPGFNLKTFSVINFIHFNSLFTHFCTFFLNFCRFTSLIFTYIGICFLFKDRSLKKLREINYVRKCKTITPMKVLSLELWMFVSYWCWVHWMDVCVVLVLGPLDRLDVDPVLDHLPQRRHLTQTTHLQSNHQSINLSINYPQSPFIIYFRLIFYLITQSIN